MEGETMRKSPLAKSDESASSKRGEHWLGDAAVLEGEMLDGNDLIQPGNVNSAVVGGLTDVKSLPLEPPSAENEADDNNENADDDDFGAFGGALEADEMPTLSDEGPEEDEYVKSMDKPVGVSEGAVVNAAVVGGLTDVKSLPLEPPSAENEADDNNENADDDDFGAFGGALEADEMPTLSDEGPEEDEYVKSMDKPVGVSEGAVVNAAVVGGLTDIESLPLEPPSVENEADDNNENADDDDFGAFGGALEADEMPTLSDEGPEEDEYVKSMDKPVGVSEGAVVNAAVVGGLTDIELLPLEPPSVENEADDNNENADDDDFGAFGGALEADEMPTLSDEGPEEDEYVKSMDKPVGVSEGAVVNAAVVGGLTDIESLPLEPPSVENEADDNNENADDDDFGAFGGALEADEMPTLSDEGPEEDEYVKSMDKPVGVSEGAVVNAAVVGGLTDIELLPLEPPSVENEADDNNENADDDDFGAFGGALEADEMPTLSDEGPEEDEYVKSMDKPVGVSEGAVVNAAVVGGLTDIELLPLEPPSVENEADDNNENADDDDFGAFGGALEADEMPTLSDEGPEEDEYVKSMDKPVGVSEGAVVNAAVVGGLTDIELLPLEPPSVENEADDNNENADDDDFGAFGGALEADEMPTLSDEGPEEDEYVKSMDKPVGVSEGAVVNAAVVGGLTDIELLPLEPPSVENEADDNNENADDDDFGAFGGALEADEMPTLSDEGPEEDEYVKSMDKPVGVSEGAVVNAAVVGGLTDIESLPLEPPSVENEADDNNENADDDDFGAFGGALEADEMPTLSDEGPEEDGLPVEYQHGITGMNVAGSALESLVQANETMSLGMQKSSAEPGWGLLDRLKKSLPDIFPVREKSADQDVVINSLGDSDDLHCIATSLNILRSGCSPFLVSSTKDRSSSSFLFAVKPASRSIPTTIATDEAKKSFEHFCRPVVGFKSLSRTADKKFACEIQNSFQVPSSGKAVGAFLHPARKGSPKGTRPILSRLVEPTMVSLPLPRAVGKEARQETTVVPSSHVKQFLQQIPDLSFMLSSKLSIPHTYS